MAFLQGPTPKQLEIIEQELGEGPGDIGKGVRDLRSMCAASSHLPEPDDIDTNVLELFVRGCRMDLQRARDKFEAFCLARTRCRDLFEPRSLSAPPLDKVGQFLDIIPLPKLTNEGYRVTIFRVRPDYPESASDIIAAIQAILLVSDARMHDEKTIAGDIFVWECSQIRGQLVGRVAAAANAIRRSTHLAHATYPQRLKRNHILAAPPFIASSLQLMRSFMTEKIRKRFHLNTKVEELFEFIPARVLPAEWGGEEESIDVIAEKWRVRVDEMRPQLQKLNDVCWAASKTLPDNDIYGAVGAFRKLDID